MPTMPSHTRRVTRSESAEKEKRKPVRRDPEKRRQQNAQAQRKYREKLRGRLDHLEALAASTAHSGIEKTPAGGTCLSEAVPTYVSPSTASSSRTEGLYVCDAPEASVFGLSVANPQEYQPFPESEGTSSALSIWDSTILDIPVSRSSSSATSIWDSIPHIDPSLLMCEKHNNNNNNNNSTPSRTTTIKCGCSSPHVQMQTQTRGPDPLSYNEVKMIQFLPSATPADPYANNLRIEPICTVSALYTVGMHIGITEEMMCADESLSPFFRFSAESMDEAIKATMIGTVKAIFKTLKPDLRPSSKQITVKHHPYIDILPFPTLRNSLIAHQDEIDEDEFFHDMLTGLVCWGGAGIGRDRNDSTGDASTGTPWDVRSWEAKVWFLKKYWAWLGGEDGELVRQSEWWRGMRGDDMLNMKGHVEI